MTLELPSLDPLWVSVFVTAVLVFITAAYTYQTGKLTKLTRISLIYQQKPYFVTEIENVGNQIFLSINNNSKSISPVKDIIVKLSMIIKNQKIDLGTYVISGILFPGEKDSPDISSIIIDQLKKLKLISILEEEFPEVDDYGTEYMASYEYLHIRKGKIAFEFNIESTYNVDIQELKKNSFKLNRVYVVNMVAHDGPPDDYNDNFDTFINMKLGKWID